MAPSKPTFVVFPGAFHSDDCLKPLLQQLESAGYDTKSATLKTVGNADLAIDDDATFMRNEILLPLLASGQDVVAVFHSYGGFPGSVAIKGLDKSSRAKDGHANSIVGIVYMCAFVPKEGDSLKASIGGQWAPWQSPDEESKLIMVPDPISVFYADVAEPEASEYAALIKGQSMKSFETASPPIGWAESGYNGRRAYIRTEHDQAIPSFGQDAMVAMSGVAWNVKKMATGHSPFLADPKSLSAILVELSESFATAA